MEKLYIPSEVHKDGNVYPITAIADSAFYNSDIRTIIVPEPVESIGNEAFSSYTLENIVLPKSLLSIGDGAFSHTAIAKVKIPSSVKTIGENAFYCSNLGSLYLSDSLEFIGDSAFDCKNLSAIYYNTEKFVTADENIFSNENYKWTINGGASLYVESGQLESIKNIEPWKHFSSIVELDFSSVIEVNNLEYVLNPSGNYYEILGANLSESTDIELPNNIVINGKEYNVRDIAPYAFSDCENLRSVTIPEGVYLNNGNFALCRNLEAVFIGGLDVSIPDYTFYGCSNLRKFVTATPMNYIGEYAFSECNINNVSLAKSATIKPQAFHMGGIRTLNVDSISTYNKDVFDESIYEYTSLNVPIGMLDSAKMTEPWMYFKNINETADLPNSIIINWENGLNYRWGNGLEVCGVYQACDEIVIPSSISGNPVSVISDNAFEDCFFIKSISIPESISIIGSNAFSGCSNLAKIEIPNSIKFIGNRSFEYCSKLIDITIPDSVTSIGQGAFQACTSLTSIDLPNTITIIEFATFNQCTSLKHINLSDSISKIEGWAFIGCENLETINIPEKLISIGESAFCGCKKMTKVILPNSMELVDEYAFSKCESLQTVVIPCSISHIAPYAFSHCDNLTEITYECSEPLTASKNVFDDATYENATLTIADGALSKIKSTEPWMYFNNIVEKIITKNDEIYVEENSSEPIEIYNLSGIKISESIENLLPGIYIIRQGRNICKKVITQN